MNIFFRENGGVRINRVYRLLEIILYKILEVVIKTKQSDAVHVPPSRDGAG